jgi:hypothetical protein
MKTVTYIGPYRQGVEIEPDPIRQPDVWALVKPGESVECSGSVAASLVQQDVWEPAGEPKLKRPPRSANKAEIRAYFDALDLDDNGRPADPNLTVDQLNEALDAHEAQPTTPDSED